jgi:glycosyltransferase involved in cell wall biosynthesis
MTRNGIIMVRVPIIFWGERALTMSSPSISIAMATYNGARYIGEQLESLACQTILPTELVVTDDNSTDETLDIVCAFATTSPFPVRIEKNATRLGYRANFMKAAALCQSDLIAFSDQDDVWLSRKLEKCRAVLDDKTTVLVYHNAEIVTANLDPLGLMDGERASQAYPRLSTQPFEFGFGFSLVFRRKLLEFGHLWPQSSDFYHLGQREGHDQWFFFLAACTGTISYMAEPLVLYRQHNANVAGWKDTSGIRQKWISLVSSDIRGLRSREYCAESRSVILEQWLQKPENQDAVLDRGVRNYKWFESVYRNRYKMYVSGTFFSKLKTFLGLLRQGAYKPKKQWGVGHQALIRDVLCGLFLCHREDDATA